MWGFVAGCGWLLGSNRLFFLRFRSFSFLDATHALEKASGVRLIFCGVVGSQIVLSEVSREEVGGEEEVGALALGIRWVF